MDSIYESRRYLALVEIKSDLTMDTVEKRVRLDVEIGKAVIELLNPRPIGRMLLELIITEQTNALRTNLKNQILWLNNVQGFNRKW